MTEDNKVSTNAWMHIVNTAKTVEGYDQYFFNRLWRKLNEEIFIVPSKILYPDILIKRKMDQAHAWLLVLDVPAEHLTKMCLLTFLALCNITPDSTWKKAKCINMSLTKDIMTFVADNYNVTYKSGTRESFRREGINILLHYGIIDLNPGNPHLGPNSPLTHYAIKEKVLKKIAK